MENENKNIKKSNSGFTLVELVVSVAILVLVSIPFLLAFTTATRINGTARNKERANTVATTEMEYLRGTQDISALLSTADRKPGGAQITLSQPISGSSTGAIVGKVVSEDQKYSDVDRRNANIYHYTRTTVVDGKQFFIDAELNPFSASSGASGAAETETAYYNNDVHQDFPVISTNKGLNVNDAQFSISDQTYEGKAVELADYYFPEQSVVREAPSGSTGTKMIRWNNMTDDVIANMKRDVTITIKNTLADSAVETHVKSSAGLTTNQRIKTEVFAKATFTYKYRGSKDYTVELPTQCIYSNVYKYADNDKITMLQNIYYSFNGNANSVASNVLDTVHIINEDNLPVSVYMMEQRFAPGSNNYYLGIYLKGGVNWQRGKISPANAAKNTTHVFTKVIADRHVQPVCYYFDSTNKYAGPNNVNITGFGIFKAKDLMHYSLYSGGGLQSDADTPIYVVTLKVYSGDETNHAREALITLNSTLQ